MSDFLSILNVDLIFATIRLYTPITLAAIGAAGCERAGIVNIAREGIMVVGPFIAACIAYTRANHW
ncbi:MAG: ABC transporter permease, partial [Spirochaetes bacterium]